MSKLETVNRFMGKTFAIWVLLFAIAAFLSPTTFAWLGHYTNWLLGVVMFGMGLTLSANDFKEVFRRPKDVAIGVVGHFVIMPLVAYLLAIGLHLPPEVAVGVILVGSCPSGTSSNVMTFLAKGDVALAVSIASVSTVLAPFTTPALILLLAQKWTPVNAGSLFLSIVEVVIVPIALALILKMFLRQQASKVTHVLPLVSVVAIVLIVAAVVAGSQQKIATTGLLIFAVVILHNLIGYALGYFFAKLCKMDLPRRKAVTFEVGMQNSGLGVAIAMAQFSPLSAVPSAIFSVWHNISGSVLASLLRRISDGNETTTEQPDTQSQMV